jgi:CysZ protein
MGGSVFRGMGYLREGFRLIREPGLRRFVIIPLALNVLVFIGLFAGLYQGFTLLIPMVMGWLPDWAWLQALDWLFWLLYGAVMVLLMAYGFVILANLIGSPFYGYLAELTEKRLTGQPIVTDDSWRQILADVPRALWRELQKITYYLPRAVLLLAVGLIPVVNLVGGTALVRL